MIKIFLYVMLVFCASSFAKPSQEIPALNPQFSDYFDILEPIIIEQNGINRQISIAKTKNHDKSYKILYILDGNAQLNIAINAYINDTSINRQTPFVLVGIGYEGNLAYDTQKRTIDYLPKPIDSAFVGGGAEEFYDFIKNQVFPIIQARYNVESSALFGHSFGGIFTLYTFINHHESFDYYFSASPSLWWDSASIADSIPALTKCTKPIFFTKGSLEQNKSKITNKQILDINDIANTLHKNGCDTKYTLFEGKTHGQVIPDALGFALKILSDTK